jgi:hypothetical protein
MDFYRSIFPRLRVQYTEHRTSFLKNREFVK